MDSVKKVIQFGEDTITLETGKVARQASGSVIVTMGDTVVLVTAVGNKSVREGQNFFPLTVNYQEKAYAAGKIPGGFFKREGRPSEMETLTCRLIDRPIRPLFPKGFMNEVQVVATVMSLDPLFTPDIPAMIGASAALAISGVPFNGPIAGARVGYTNGEYVLNPSEKALEGSDLDMVVAGTESAVLMVESEAKQLSESVMLGAVMFAHEQCQPVIAGIKELAQEAGKPRWDWQAPAENEALKVQVEERVQSDVVAAYQIQEKPERNEKLSVLRDAAVTAFVNDEEGAPDAEEVLAMVSSIEKRVVRDSILAGNPRIDGRDTKTVRPITVETGVLPRTHGSALFTRGETQAIVVATLGTERDAQLIDALSGEFRDNFMLHYNFPPYCVGEAGMMSGPKRREIGHGRLARRAIAGVLPTMEEFPYTMRVVSEITESNGSSSMASVCGTSLALMDAGVPVKAPVAGIAMGLIKEDNKFAVLSDILGDEDHLGDMDFKVAGTANGITALQMDIKIEGIDKTIMEAALEQAKAGREHILGIMNQLIESPRQEMSRFAPRITTFKIHPDKIRDVIGKGGVTIRTLIEETGVAIDINDDGVVTLASSDGEASEEARRRIDMITSEAEPGQVHDGKVTKITDFGAFVALPVGKKEGLVHISQISNDHVKDVRDVLSEGQQVTVKVLEVDRQGRIRLSMKALLEEVEE